jgi:hypothetical protein
MTLRKIGDVATLLLSMGMLAAVVWRTSQDYQVFIGANPASDIWDYLLIEGPSFLTGALVAFILFVVVKWWTRPGDDPDSPEEFRSQ